MIMRYECECESSLIGNSIVIPILFCSVLLNPIGDLWRFFMKCFMFNVWTSSTLPYTRIQLTHINWLWLLHPKCSQSVCATNAAPYAYVPVIDKSEHFQFIWGFVTEKHNVSTWNSRFAFLDWNWLIDLKCKLQSNTTTNVTSIDTFRDHKSQTLMLEALWRFAKSRYITAVRLPSTIFRSSFCHFVFQISLKVPSCAKWFYGGANLI